MSLEQFQRDYPRWHAGQVLSGDIDPVYPVLSNLSHRWGLDEEQTAWLVFLHVAFYQPGSTLAAFSIAPSVLDLPETAESLGEAGLLSLPCGVERRGHRDTRQLAAHLLALSATFRESGVIGWLDSLETGIESTTEAWEKVGAGLRGIYGNGRWASYKTAEMLQKVVELAIEAPDAGHQFSSGPRRGLEILEPFCPVDNTKGAIAVLDFLTECWADVLGEPDLAQVETSLCDFYSLSKGSYYLGHDIDSLQSAWSDPRVAEYVGAEAWEARRDSFPAAFLGEHNGWDGVRVDLKRVYRDTGEILHLDLVRKAP